MSGLVNKVKEALHSDKSGEVPEGTHGTHSSKVANAADPRFDSDRDHRANPATGTGVGHNTGTAGYGHDSSNVTGHNKPAGTHGATTGSSSSHVTGYNDPAGTHGPHSSKIANAADPRVDSDRDHRGAPGTTGLGSVGHATGHTTSGHHATGAATEHNNTSAGGPGVTGYNDPTGTHGPHSSRVANAADPRIDSDRDHRAAPGAAGTAGVGLGAGPAPNTAGPHAKDILNKLDPRVDSDLDGSKTLGGNKTVS